LYIGQHLKLVGRPDLTIPCSAAYALSQWFSTFHGLWPPFPFNWLIINIVTLGFCIITAELISKSLLLVAPGVPLRGSRSATPWPPRGAEGPVEKPCSKLSYF